MTRHPAHASSNPHQASRKCGDQVLLPLQALDDAGSACALASAHSSGTLHWKSADTYGWLEPGLQQPPMSRTQQVPLMIHILWTCLRSLSISLAPPPLLAESASAKGAVLLGRQQPANHLHFQFLLSAWFILKKRFSYCYFSARHTHAQDLPQSKGSRVRPGRTHFRSSALAFRILSSSISSSAS